MIRGAARTASPIQQSDLPPLGGREVQLVRLRLALIVVATALIAIVSGAALSAIVAPDPDGRLNAAIRSAPLVSLGAGRPAKRIPALYPRSRRELPARSW